MKLLLRSLLAFTLLLTPLPRQSVAETLSVARGSAGSEAQGAAETVVSGTEGGIVSIESSEGDLPLVPVVQGREDLKPEHRQALAEILSLLPSRCSGQIKHLYVRYDHPADRGLAGKDTVIVSGNVSTDEFRALLVHEILGHVLDLGCLQGTASAGASAYPDGATPTYSDDPSVLFYSISWETPKQRRADAGVRDFVSGYAYGSDAFEDLAESVTFYVFHRDEFRRLARSNDALARKLQWIEVFAFPSASSFAQSTYRWSARSIPWDTTKLPYEWIGTKTALAQG